MSTCFTHISDTFTIKEFFAYCIVTPIPVFVARHHWFPPPNFIGIIITVVSKKYPAVKTVYFVKVKSSLAISSIILCFEGCMITYSLFYYIFNFIFIIFNLIFSFIFLRITFSRPCVLFLFLIQNYLLIVLFFFPSPSLLPLVWL